jgi:hypothetical protein
VAAVDSYAGFVGLDSYAYAPDSFLIGGDGRARGSLLSIHPSISRTCVAAFTLARACGRTKRGLEPTK